MSPTVAKEGVNILYAMRMSSSYVKRCVDGDVGELVACWEILDAGQRE